MSLQEFPAFEEAVNVCLSKATDELASELSRGRLVSTQRRIESSVEAGVHGNS